MLFNNDKKKKGIGIHIMHKLVMLLLIITTSQIGNVVHAEEIPPENIRIEGNIVLPEVASGYIQFSVRAESENNEFGSGLFFGESYLDIPPGQSSGVFAFDIPQSASPTFNISYQCHYYDPETNINGCESLGYLSRGFYNANGTVVESSDATSLAATVPLTGLDFPVKSLSDLDTDSINGNVILAGGAPSGGLTVNVSANSQHGRFTKAITFAEGESSKPYAIDVVRYLNTFWDLSYQCVGDCADNINSGYFNSQLSSGSDHENTDIVLTEAVRIEGTVTLPSPVPATSGAAAGHPVSIDVRAEEAGAEFAALFFGASVNIFEGDSTGSYSIKMPKSASPTFRVSYNCSYHNPETNTNGCEGLGYLSQGFYNETGTVVDSNDASPLLATHSFADINLSVKSLSDLEADTISGQVILAEGAPVGGLVIDITAHGRGSFSQAVTFAEGERNKSYAIEVVRYADAFWDMYYQCRGECVDYINHGYSSLQLSSEFDHSGVDIVLTHATRIEGSIILPTPVPVTATGGAAGHAAHFNISTQTNDAAILFGDSYAFIQEGERSASYSIKMPTSATPTFSVRYQCHYNNPETGVNGCENIGYTPQGYYSQQGVVDNSGDATALTAENTLTGIDFNIVSTGTVSNDDDADGILNGVDNCPTDYNPTQDNYDNDLEGDACDPDDDNDGMPDDWELLFTLNPFDPIDATLDADNDGSTNLEEFQGGSDPLDFNSTPAVQPIQSVSIQNSVDRARLGQEFTLKTIYTNSVNNPLLTGLGVRIHFDSTKLVWKRFESVIDGVSGQDTVPIPDSEDLDGNPDTDQYLNVGWSSLNGEWPNQILPTQLYGAVFEFRSDVGLVVAQTTTIGFSSSATANGFTFNSTPYIIEVAPEFSWDIDGSNTPAEPLTDGLLVLRYLFDFHGDSLVVDAIDASAERSTAVLVEDYLSVALANGTLDIDGDGVTGPLTDGLLILRYLFDFTGETLIQDVISAEATRTTASEVEAYMQQFL